MRKYILSNMYSRQYFKECFYSANILVHSKYQRANKH